VIKHRHLIVILATVIGVLGILGSALFTVAGAGMYGSPFAGDTYFNLTLLLVLLCGPVAILPCTILDRHKPGLGGLALCGFAIVAVVPITLNNIRQWGFAIQDAGVASFCLAFPMFTIGSMLLFSSPPQRSELKWIWRVELLILSAIAVCYSWLLRDDVMIMIFGLPR
jgi:drug/metabolite transporter (DMT)-like permease